jgi:hypothetical protein
MSAFTNKIWQSISTKKARLGFQRVSSFITGWDTNRAFQFQKRRQLLIGLHNETLSVVAMRICNKDRSPVGIDR